MKNAASFGSAKPPPERQSDGRLLTTLRLMLISEESLL